MNHYITMNGTRLFPVFLSRSGDRPCDTVEGRFAGEEWLVRSAVASANRTECTLLREDGMVYHCEQCAFALGGPGERTTFTGVIARRFMAESPAKIRRAIRSTEAGRA